MAHSGSVAVNQARLIMGLQMVTLAAIVPLALGYYHKETHPPVAIYDPHEEYVSVAHSNRDDNLNRLWRGALLDATRIATASFPYDAFGFGTRDDELDLSDALYLERFSTVASDPVRQLRDISVRKHADPYWVPKLYYNGPPEVAVNVVQRSGTIHLEGLFTQSYRVGNERFSVGWDVKAEAVIAAHTELNPWGLQFKTYTIRILKNDKGM